MRIISGSAKGRKLLSPSGMNTRPTLDRVKESMFSIIQKYLFNSITIDLFSGTGSLGLEAASRGALKCYLVEKDKATYELLLQNVDKLGLLKSCECFNEEALDVLRRCKRAEIIFNVVFIDPPYKKNMIPSCIEFISENKMLDNEGIIVTKIDSSEEIYHGNNNIVLSDKRKYGNTTIVFYKLDNK